MERALRKKKAFRLFILSFFTLFLLLNTTYLFLLNDPALHGHITYLFLGIDVMALTGMMGILKFMKNWLNSLFKGIVQITQNDKTPRALSPYRVIKKLATRIDFLKLYCRLIHKVSFELAADKESLAPEIKAELEKLKLDDEELVNSIYGIEKRLVEKNNALKKKIEEEETREWITNGIRKFAELLQHDDDDLESKMDNIVRNLAEYLNLNQICLYLVENENENVKAYLKLKSTYAYNRKKYIDNTIEQREGLISEAWLNNSKIVLTDLPQNYMNITSGLGEATASFVMIIPLNYNQEVIGIIEVASFKTLQKHEQDLLEQLINQISASIYSNISKDKTKKLLEESQKMTNILKEHEEEFRQNAEEMRANQEQLSIRVEKQIEQIEKLKDVTIELIVDAAGRNRMLSQQMAFLAKLVAEGKTEYIPKLKDAMNLFDNTINTFKLGGVLPGMSVNREIQPLSEKFSGHIENIDMVWMPFYKACQEIINKDADKQKHTEVIEKNFLKLLSLNNDLVRVIVSDSYNRKMEIFEELTEVIRV